MDDPRTAAAVVTAAVAVIVAVVGQISTWSLEHRNRVYERRRSALLDTQDAALRVRRAVQQQAQSLELTTESSANGTDVDVREDPAALRERADADAFLEVYLARVESVQVARLVRTWHQSVRYSFLGSDDVTSRDEETAWAALNAEIGRELLVPGFWRRASGLVRRRPRRDSEKTPPTAE